MTPPADVSLSLWLAAGSVAGGALHAWVTNSDAFLSRTTAGNLFIGAIIGILYPLYPIIDFPENALVIHKAAMMAGVAYITGDAIQNLLPGVFAKFTGQKKA